ncbi:MAG: serine/threonine protein kinase [Planctomycetaceae bacterium]|nr:serine/threonine protein kinase [Planctomycetaceae bacterium]
MSDSNPNEPTHLVDKLNQASLLDLALDQEPAGPRRAYALPSQSDLAPLFPDFEIQDLLGFGGMGCVYKARQTRLDRAVAIKILPKELAKDELFSERFAREARAMARLNHPNVVRVYDFGQAGDVCFLIMEYMDGMNLRELLNAGSLPASEVLRVFEQVCLALDYAHREGVVHRDIKPENILFSKTGHASLADFGLARLAMDSGCEVSLTQTRQAMGTLNYMAPEQWENPKTVDHRADIYALGILLYELLTGRVPRGSFPPASSLCGSPPAIDSVINKALQVDPALRYQSVMEMVQALSAEAPGVTNEAIHFGTFTRIVNLGGLVSRPKPAPVAKRKVARPIDEKGTIRSTNMSLFIACATCFGLFMTWTIEPVGLDGMSLAIQVEDVVVPNWLVAVGAVTTFILLRWREAVHPFRSLLFANALNFASVIHLIALVSRGCPAVSTDGLQVLTKLNVIPYLLLAMLVLQQIELAWRMIVFIFFFLIPSDNSSDMKKTKPSRAPEEKDDLEKKPAAAKSRDTASLLQKVVKLLPAGLGDDIEAESRSWHARCRCGCERSIWDLGGIRYKAAGEPLRFLYCPDCNKLGWHRVVRKDEFPKDVV